MTNDNDARGALLSLCERIEEAAGREPIWIDGSAADTIRAILAAPRQPGEMGAGVQTCPRCGKPTAMLFEFDGTRHCGCLHTQSAASAQQDERETSEPPLGGRWHHGNGVVVCGTLRVFTEDFDTDPAQEFKEQLLTWVCATLNAAQGRAAQQVQADAGAVAWRTGEIVWAVEEDAKRHAHWNKLTVESLYTRPAAESDKRDDAALLDWLMHNIGGSALRAIGVITSAGCDRDAIRAAMSREQSGGDRG